MTHEEYNLKDLNVPRLAGLSLSLVTWITENSLLRGLVSSSLFKNAGITWLRALEIDDAPTYEPHPPVSHSTSSQAGIDLSEIQDKEQTAPTQDGFNFLTSFDYAHAYRQGAADPLSVAEKVLAAIQESNNNSPPLRAMIACLSEDVLAQANASKKRFEEGRPLSLLDGVPVAIKDEIDQAPYGTSDGTSFFGKTPAVKDSTVVARLRSAGALLIGKANMHEIGIGVTGFNQHHGTARNPYNLLHHTGGSSSGPASAVAAGLAPLAIGADGGGSIRIPAGFCGVVGLKPTFGRVSEKGAFPTNWSVAHIGPIGASTLDVALGYALIAGVDANDPHTFNQPDPTLQGFQQADLSDLSVGIYEPWVHHATPEISAAFDLTLERLQKMGLRIKKIRLANLEAARVAHMITISSEMVTGLDRVYHQHRQDFSLEVRYDLALARLFTARDYVKAQQFRTRLIEQFERAFEEVDLVLTPTTAVTAPPIRPDTLAKGESDFVLLTKIMRFATPANLTGHPAISVPIGYDSQGLPIGLQAIGRYWQEHALLRFANIVERLNERQRPALYYQYL